MKVLHLSTYDIRGGAARSAFRFHQGMLTSGIESHMLVRSKWGHGTNVHAFSNLDSVHSRIRRRFEYWLLQQRLKKHIKPTHCGYDPFTVDLTNCGIKCAEDFDILNLHWVSGFVNPSQFFQTNQKIPIVWRFSDLNPMTGGCHYDSGCGKYLERCRRCPQLASSSEKDISYEIWERKRKTFRSLPIENLFLVAQSNWMAEQMQCSPLFGRFPVKVIANGVDTDVYRPTARPGLRTALGIPEGDNVVLFVATSTKSRRKGFSVLLEALSQIDKNFWLLSVGGDEPLGLQRHRHLWLGKIDNDHVLSAVYNAADIFVLPSLQDNLPNTALEAFACGTPVVGFNSGGISDIVEQGVSGYLVATRDIKGLVESVEVLLRDRVALHAMRKACRKRAVEDFNLPTQVGIFKEFYEEIFSNRESLNVKHNKRY